MDFYSLLDKLIFLNTLSYLQQFEEGEDIEI